MQKKKRIPRGNDRKKGKGERRSRSLRDDNQKGNDNDNGNSNSNGKGKGKGKGNSKGKGKSKSNYSGPSLRSRMTKFCGVRSMRSVKAAIVCRLRLRAPEMVELFA